MDRQAKGINYRQCKNIVSFDVHLNESYTLNTGADPGFDQGGPRS